MNTEIDFTEGFAVGEGRYKVDLIVSDKTDRVLRKTWRIVAARSHAEHAAELTVPRNTVRPLLVNRWNGKLLDVNARTTPHCPPRRHADLSLCP